MPNIFETNWLAKTLAKGDKLLVPNASKANRALWARAQMPVWDAPVPLTSQTLNAPWWLLQKNQVLDVLARPSRQAGSIWVPIAFKDGECQGWILSEHAYACGRHRATKQPPPAQRIKPQPVRVSDLRPGVVLEYNHEMAVVISWRTDRLPTPDQLACVSIEQVDGKKEVWLTQLVMP